MPRKTLSAHLRKTGPGTGGRNWERDKQICAEKKETGMTNEALAKRFALSHERIRQILDQGERDDKAGRTRWMSTAERRAEVQKHWRRDSA